MLACTKMIHRIIRRFPIGVPSKIFPHRFYQTKYKLAKYTKKTNPKITILEILLYKIQSEIMKSKIFTRFNSCEHGFVIKLKHVKILDFIISGYILYTKISRIVIFGLVSLVYFLKLSVGNGCLQNN